MPSSSSPSPPPARRTKPTGWRDLRLWAGLALVALSAVLGARVLGSGSDTVEVWQAVRDLPAGEPVAVGDVTPVRVPSSVAALGYATADEEVGGSVTRPVAAGELLPAGALAASGQVPGREVTVPVDEGHFPVGLAAGERVDAWVSDNAAGADVGAPRLVLEGARISAVSEEGFGLAGQVAVVLEVPEESVEAMVAALRGGVIDLVAVPLDAVGDMR